MMMTIADIADNGDISNTPAQRKGANRVRMNQLWLGKLSPPKARRVVYWDTDFVGLGLRVSPARPGDTQLRAKWFVSFRPKANGAKRWVPIGPVSEIPAPAAARAQARDILIKARDGFSVAGVEVLDGTPSLNARHAASAAATSGHAGLIDGKAQYPVFLLPLYLHHCETKRKRPNLPETVLDKERVLTRHVIPLWGKRDLRTISRQDAEDLIDGLSELPGAQYKVYSMLHDFLTWAVKKQYVEKHPMAGMGSPYEYDPRDRTLSDDEIRWFWLACDELGWPHGTWAKTLLLTAQRCKVVSRMLRSEVDHDYMWHIPKTNPGAKSKHKHIVPLSNLAKEIIIQVPNCYESDHFFRGKGNSDPIKRKMNEIMLRLKRQELAARGDINAQHVTIEPWVFHDLRRTAATIMARLGHDKDVVHKILNHSEGRDRGLGMLDVVYIIYDYMPERVKALQDLGNYISRVVTETPKG